MWQSAMNQKDYRAFIVGLSPLLYRLQKRALTTQWGNQIRIHPSGERNKCTFPEEINLILNHLNEGRVPSKYLTSSQWNEIVQSTKTLPISIKKELGDLRKYEENVRNIIAHQLTEISTDKVIYKEVGPKEIVDKAWKLMLKLNKDNPKFSSEYRTAYRSINNKIEAMLYQGRP